jgi:elongator complex protein 1
MLLTPFRTQNIPPPMSSHQLALPSADATYPSTPVHAAFSPDKDLIAVLYEHGFFRLWDLRTRLGPGKGKVMDPRLVHEESLKDNMDTTAVSYRQIVFLRRSGSTGTLETKFDEWSIVILGTLADGQDEIILRDSAGSSKKAGMSVTPNGRLLDGPPLNCVFWQSASGEIHEGAAFFTC